MVVDWVNRKIQINALHLQQLMNAIRSLLELFTDFRISHIYRELNMEADGLSKLALLLDPGNLEIEEIIVNYNQFLDGKMVLSINANEDVYMI